MKSRILTCITAAILFAALAIPVQLAAQHTRNKLVDVGTFAPEDTEGLLAGLWHGVISSPDNSFPSFETFEQYGEGTWTGSGQPDLTPAGLSSPALGRWKRVGQRKFRVVGRFWTYDPSENPTGYGAVDVTITVSENGNTYHGQGTLQFFDNNGHPVGSAPFVANATRITLPQVAESD